MGENAGRRSGGSPQVGSTRTNGYWGELGTRASLASLNKVARERAGRWEHPQVGGTGDKAGRRSGGAEGSPHAGSAGDERLLGGVGDTSFARVAQQSRKGEGGWTTRKRVAPETQRGLGADGSPQAGSAGDERILGGGWGHELRSRRSTKREGRGGGAPAGLHSGVAGGELAEVGEGFGVLDVAAPESVVEHEELTDEGN